MRKINSLAQVPSATLFLLHKHRIFAEVASLSTLKTDNLKIYKQEALFANKHGKARSWGIKLQEMDEKNILQRFFLKRTQSADYGFIYFYAP